jgi:P27 family predicted phage terminase small subunit
MLGRPPKPTNLKLLHGTARADRMKNEPGFRPGRPSRPQWLLPEAKREWNRIVPELESNGLLATVHRAALANYCQWWARWVQAEKALAEHGLTFTTESGYVQQRPEVAIAQKSAQLCKAFLVEFGLTPSSQTRVNVPEKQAEDPMEAFIRRGRAVGS